MKKFLKFIFGVIGSIYLLFAIFVTVCLLCYNEYKVTQFGDKSFIIIDDKSDEYTSGDLVIFTKNPNEENQYRILSFPWCISGKLLSIIKFLKEKN